MMSLDNYELIECGQFMAVNLRMLIKIDLLHEPHNAPILYPTMYHFVTEMCTFLLQNGALWAIQR